MDGFETFRFLVKSDLFRYGDGVSLRSLCDHYWRTPGFRYSVWLRAYRLASSWRCGRWGLRQFISWRHRKLSVHFGISIPVDTLVGPGLYIGHFGGIVVHHDVRIGANCNLSQEVTIGLASRGDRFGCPTIGNNVYIGPGAKIFGRITIGDRAAIGANAVVTKDVADGAVMVGVPAKIVSYAGSDGYVCNTDYP
jgi:serine O-acetyltransferase